MCAALDDRYTIERKLGESRFAITRLARRKSDGRRFVVKTLAPESEQNLKAIELLEREARVLQNLDHPRIPRFVELIDERSSEGRRHHLVQEYIEGQNLAEAVRAGRRFTEGDVLRIGIELAKILEHLQSFSPPIIHRDIKPSNIMLDMKDQVHLVDFGAVRDKMMQDELDHGGGSTIVGTYGFMPYEQFEGRALPASDIYSLGVTLVFLLSQKEPHELEKKGMRFVIDREVRVSRAFQSVLETMIEPDWEHRIQSASDLRRALETLAAPARSKTVTKPRPATWAVVPVLAILAAGFLFLRRQPESSRLDSVTTTRSSIVTRSTSPLRRPSVSAPIDQGRPPRNAHESQLTGRLIFDGKPLHEVTSARPTFWFRNEKLGKQSDVATHYSGGRFWFFGLEPGSYGVQIMVDANKANPSNSYPGDFYAWQPFTIHSPLQAERDIEVHKIIRLRSPEDSSLPIGGGTDCSTFLSFAAPITVAWDSLGDDVVYEYSIDRTDCATHRTDRKVVAGTTRETAVDLQLPPTSSDAYYRFDIKALHKGRWIGQLVTHGDRWMGWDYRFRVSG